MRTLVRTATVAAALLLLPLTAGAGSTTYSSPGWYPFTVPTYGTLTAHVWGAGAGGEIAHVGGFSNITATAGEYSTFGNIVSAGGGQPGAPDMIYSNSPGGAGGWAAGGDANYNGNQGNPTDLMTFINACFGANVCDVSGGTAPNGGGGGGTGGGWGGTPGGGGGAGPVWTYMGLSGGAGGGSGGYAYKTFSSGALSSGSTIWIYVGNGGAGAYDDAGGWYNPFSYIGGNGGAGQVTITWTPPTNPTCTLTVDTNPVAYGASTTLRWSSSNSTTFFLSNAGYVTANTAGSAQVGPLSTTTYSGLVTGSTGATSSCAVTLGVRLPSTCTFNGNTVAHGGTVTGYQAGTVPDGTSCASQTRTCTNGILSGSYAYATCAVAPTCALTLSPSTLVQGQSANLSWTSSRASSCTGTGFSTGTATSGSLTVSPLTSTAYGLSCTGTGGTTSCSANASSIDVSCPVVYSCTGTGLRTLHKVASDCSESDVTTCSAPSFCSNGAAACLTTPPAGSITVTPSLVRGNGTTQVSWNATSVASCTVAGSNGDSWSGTSGTKTSLPITGATTYTLSCTGLNGDTIVKRVTVGLVPGWRER